MKYDAMDAQRVLRGRLVWDMVPHESAAKVMSLMDMVPPSAEGQEMACRDSHQRMNLVIPLTPMIQMLSETLAEVLIASLLGEKQKELDAQLQDQVVMFYRQVLEVSARVVVANLLSSEILKYQ